MNKEGVFLIVLLTALVLIVGIYTHVEYGVQHTAMIHDIPSEILIGNPDEDGGIMAGYIDGRVAAVAGNDPHMGSIPESYYYGYCHGYADNSEINFTTVYRVANENAWSTIQEEDVKHG